LVLKDLVLVLFLQHYLEEDLQEVCFLLQQFLLKLLHLQNLQQLLVLQGQHCYHLHHLQMM
jgi:hypothetical protein